MPQEFQPLPSTPPPPSPPLHPHLTGASTRGARLAPSASSLLNPHPDGLHGRALVDVESSDSSSSHGTRPESSSAAYSMRHDTSSHTLDMAALGVQSGAVGGSYDRFPRASHYSLNYSPSGAPFYGRESRSASDMAIEVGSARDNAPTNRYSHLSADSYDDGVLEKSSLPPPDEALLWDKSRPDVDDYLHNPDPEVEKMLDRQWGSISWRGLLNVSALLVLVTVLVGLFAGWPIYRYVIKGGFPDGANTHLGWNIGGINGSGQVPSTGLPTLVDKATPDSALVRTGFDGETYNLVFSDEFNTDGRTFWPGDDPFWEAVDLHYWQTTDLEWYDPDAIITKDGKLVITLSEEPIHNLNFRSGMLQSWNKFCFSGGYIEVSMSMPGTPHAQGYWPGAWTMGNLGRAGYGAANDGMWPYSYGACDVGTLPNQTWPNGTSPAAAKQSGDPDYGGELSYLPGQRASACTCPGEDHPGPNVGVGRGAPEIDINEAQVDYRGIGSASQSIQMAPMDAGYGWKNETPYIEVWNTSRTFQNIWHGSVNQESMSVISLTDTTSYEGAGYTNFGFEYDPGPSGRITWAINETQTWQLNADAMGPNADAQISQRLISVEPMSINLNLAISTKFQTPEWSKLTFPGHLYIDYVRVYQKKGQTIGCDPSDYPTTDYINNHLEAYLNPNATTWAQANFTFPRNSLSAKGCSD